MHIPSSILFKVIQNHGISPRVYNRIATAPKKAAAKLPLLIDVSDAAPVLCANVGCALVDVALVLLDEPEVVLVVRTELISVDILLIIEDCWLKTLAHPEHCVATAG